MVRLLQTLLLFLTVVVGILWWEGYLKKEPAPMPAPKVQISEPAKKCKVAELYEGAWQPYDMLFMISVIEHAAGQPCDNFVNYTLLRAVSQAPGSAIRDADVVIGKVITTSQKAHLGWARLMVDLAVKGGLDAVLADKDVAAMLQSAESGFSAAQRELAAKVRVCARRTARVWTLNLNTAGTDRDAMRRESHPTLHFKTPSGAEFFCPKDAKL